MDLSLLKSALEPLSKFGQDEHTFEVEGVPVTLRPLLPREEIVCQKTASLILDEAREGTPDLDQNLPRAVALDYLDQFRIEVISFALVQIGEVDFRGIKTVKTGNKTDEGIEIRVALNVAIRRILRDAWSRGMITICFAKYGDLVSKIAEQADRVARESIADLDAEISRVEARLTDLKEDREKRAQGDPSITSQQIMSLVQVGNALEDEIQDAVSQARDDRKASRDIEKAGDEEQPAPPEPPQPEPAPPEPQPEPVPQPRKPVIPARVPPPVPRPTQVRSSFEDLESPDSQAIEEDRIRAAQRAAQQGDREETEGFDASQATPEGTIIGKDGKPVDVFRMPSQTLSGRGRPQKSEKTEIDPDPDKGTRNPNWKG
jgi:hypothetical protein